MTDAGYVIGGYGITAVAVLGYVVRLGWRARALRPRPAPPAEAPVQRP